jgi:antitoxin component YwqK of YwqJK toxin-antitoxin module
MAIMLGSWKYFLIIVWLIQSFIVKAQTKMLDHSDSGLISIKKNNIDSSEFAQGYWKTLIPDSEGRFSNTEEGFYFNSKKVGIWIKRNKVGQIFEMNIYHDSSQSSIEKFEFNLSGSTLKAHGYYAYLPIEGIDTMVYSDPVGKRDLIFIKDSALMKHGKWTTYHLNGHIASVGFFIKGKKSGRWVYYKINGEIEREEQY